MELLLEPMCKVSNSYSKDRLHQLTCSTGDARAVESMENMIAWMRRMLTFLVGLSDRWR
jgi:hypothetical protein